MRFSRWLVPATVAATVAGGVVVTSASAGGAPTVPDRTPAQVLASVTTSRVSALSGTVSTRADLGLPSLPTSIGDSRGPDGDAADPRAVALRLLTGRTTLRVWLDGPQRQRVQLLDDFAEVAFVHDGRDVWAFDTNRNAGTHVVLPDEAALTSLAERRAAQQRADGALPGPLGGDPLGTGTPDALAREVLGRLDPTTAVTLDPPQTVAGRAAYTLVVTPRTDATLVERAVLAVDAANGMPLRVQVYARGAADPVLESGFRDLDLARPDAARFAFTPPAGADITTQTVPLPDGTGPTRAVKPDVVTPKGTDRAGAGGGQAGTRVIGSGWSAIVETRPSADGAASGAAAMLDEPLVQQLTTPVDGGRAVRTALFSVLLTDDGRVLVGAVPVEALVSAAR
ncbi:MAG: LolA family protein [Kineosporiaceae bacterium]